MTKKARESEREAVRDELLDLLAHDIRNPLHTILLSSEILETRFHAQDPVAKRYVGVIRDAVVRIQHVVENVVAMSTQLADAAPTETARCSVRRAVMEVVRDHRAVAEAGGVGLQVQVQAADREVRMDAGSLVRVLTNLVDNAIRFTPAGGSVTLSATATAERVVLAVHDTGSGIAAADLPGLFDRPVSPREHHGHMGFGLYIVKRIVKAWGGRVWAHSRVGAGSCFTLVLRAVPPEPAGAGADERSQQAALPETGHSVVARTGMN